MQPCLDWFGLRHTGAKAPQVRKRTHPSFYAKRSCDQELCPLPPNKKIKEIAWRTLIVGQLYRNNSSKCSTIKCVTRRVDSGRCLTGDNDQRVNYCGKVACCHETWRNIYGLRLLLSDGPDGRCPACFVHDEGQKSILESIQAS